MTDRSTLTGSFGILASEIVPERVQWLSYGRLAVGMITMLNGDPGLGKSTVAVDWAARITRGDPLPDGQPTRPRGVVYCTSEDHHAVTLRPRLDVAGADPSRVVVEKMTEATGEEVMMSLPKHVDDLEDAIRDMDAALVVIDPLFGYLDEGINSISDQQVRRGLAPVKAMLERTGAGMMALRHLNKNSSQKALYRGGGSIAITGAARFDLIAAKDPDDDERRVLAVNKANLGLGDRTPSLAYRVVGIPGTDVANIEWLGESSHKAKDLTSEEDDESTGNECRDWLRDVLSNGALPATQIFKAGRAHGYNERRLRRALDALGGIKSREGFGKGSQVMWSRSIGDTQGPIPDIGDIPDTYSPYGPYGENSSNGDRYEDIPTGSGVYVCMGCGVPRAMSTAPCPTCGETKGTTR